MTEQPASGTMTGDIGAHGLDAQTGLPQGHEAHHGRPASWVAVSIIIIGFCVGGIALPIGPTWWLFWVGAGDRRHRRDHRRRHAHSGRLVLKGIYP